MPAKRAVAAKPTGLTLNIKIISARNLAAKDDNGSSDPYCVLKLGTVVRKNYSRPLFLSLLRACC